MTDKKAQFTSKTIGQDSIAGAGGGMLIASLANNLPQDNPYKSWLLILAPLLTIIIKSIWEASGTEIVSKYKNKMARESIDKTVTNIHLLLKDPSISDERKVELRVIEEHIKVSVIYELLAQIKKLKGSSIH